MSIKAIFPPGQNEITVNGLHQWDYGRQLEIHSEDLPAAFEVHFAYPGIGDAIVRTCAAVDEKATVSIPDKCLEQTAPITAWVYEIDGSKGATTKTITLTIIQRARPRAGEEVPAKYIDKYAEALTAISSLTDSLKSGEVIVKKAQNADRADVAESVEIDGKAPFQAPTSNVYNLQGEGYYCIITQSPYGSDCAPVITYWDGKTAGLLGMVQPSYHDGESRENRTLCLCVEENGQLVLDCYEELYSGSSNLVDLGYTLDVIKLWG